ncbi:MAG: hypothetical protein WAN04_15505 [Candidatus Udaeobacter sp.]
MVWIADAHRELETDSNDNVTSARFGITDPDFSKASSHKFEFPSDCRRASYGFQVNLVGPPGSACTFTSGTGILTYSALDSLAVQSTNKCGSPPAASGGAQFITGETSNSVYGDVFAALAWDLCQRFYQGRQWGRQWGSGEGNGV